jgi:hypothetical protein
VLTQYTSTTVGEKEAASRVGRSVLPGEIQALLVLTTEWVAMLSPNHPCALFTAPRLGSAFDVFAPPALLLAKGSSGSGVMTAKGELAILRPPPAALVDALLALVKLKPLESAYSVVSAMRLLLRLSIHSTLLPQVQVSLHCCVCSTQFLHRHSFIWTFKFLGLLGNLAPAE